MDNLSFMSRAEGDVQRSLGLAKEYRVKVFALRKDMYITPLQEGVVSALDADDAIESFQTTFDKTMVELSLREKLVYEVSEV